MSGGLSVSVRKRRSEITRHVTGVERKHIPGATANALTSTARAVRKRGNKRIRAATRLTAKVVNGRTDVIRARPNRWSAKVSVYTGAVNLLRAYPARSQYKGRKRGQIVAGPFRFPKGFVQHYEGRDVIFERKTEKSHPLRAGIVQFREPSRVAYKGAMRLAGPHFSREFRRGLSARLRKRGFSAAASRVEQS